jgi:predicted TIM-barrel fold metal-dependent hydrolase
VRRAVVLSLAYQYGNPNQRPVPDEYARVREENDWTAEQVARFPDRLRAFCGVDPLKSYALAEIARCAGNPYLHFGLKLHFGNSDVDLDNPQHVAQLRRVFAAADQQGMAIVVHLHASVTRKRPYGATEAAIFLRDVLPSAPHVSIQIAHLAGSGGYDDPPTDAALAVFIDAIANNDPRVAHLFFDISGVAVLGDSPATRDLIAKRIREVGLRRILWGSDGAFGAGTTPQRSIQAFRKLPLTPAELQIIAANLPAYMR